LFGGPALLRQVAKLSNAVRGVDIALLLKRGAKMAWLSARQTKNAQSRQNWFTLIFAAALFVSPWTLGYAGDAVAARTAWISASLIGALILAAVFRFAAWADWVAVAAGIWLIVAPWLLAYASVGSATFAHVALGAIVAFTSAARIVRRLRIARTVRAATLRGRRRRRQ
jgi:hypothetical protein